MANSSVVLGLDVGTASIGWCLLDEIDERVIAAGVRVFPEGVDRDNKGGEKSKGQDRRQKRGQRRQHSRRRLRRRRLQLALTEAGLLPSDAQELRSLFALDPYELRARALDEPLPPHHLGRALVHLGQRRGFKSNRKTDRRDKDTSETLEKINELEAEIHETGARTLGEYLHQVRRRQPRPTAGRHPVRGVFRTHRSMYEREFERLWEAQAPHHPELLTDSLRTVVHHVIFHQREMYWPAATVGRCELEPSRRRCHRADRAAQRFRILQETNNLKFVDQETGEERPLDPDERAAVIERLTRKKEQTFDQLRRLLGLHDRCVFNLEGPDRKKLKGHETDTALASVSKKKDRGVGPRWWELDSPTKDEVVGVLLTEADEQRAMERLVELGLTADEAQRASQTPLPSGRASFSRDAIDRLIPPLEAGLPLMGNDASDSAIHAAGYLRPDERTGASFDTLPSLRSFEEHRTPIPNPIVRRALVEVRKVVNAAVRQHGRPDAIRVEMTREAKRGLAARERMRLDNYKRQRERDAARELITEMGASPTAGLTTRFVIWERQGRECAYSGRPISPRMLVEGEADVDHILPRWRSLDDSQANKVVCHVSENRAKGDRTPREWLEDADPEKYHAVLRRFWKYGYPQLRRAQQKDIKLDEFVARQLTDTAYISRLAVSYLRQLGGGVTVDVVRGGAMTAELRRRWGLNSLVGEGGAKSRRDHRHHAVDAAVIALVNAQRLHALASSRGEPAPPWIELRSQLADRLQSMIVSHRPVTSVTGHLHEDTVYGPTHKPPPDAAPDAPPRERPGHAKHWIESKDRFVRRIEVRTIDKPSKLESIRDPTIKRILVRHLEALGVDPAETKAFPKGVFEGENEPRMPSGVPIRRVRSTVKDSTLRPRGDTSASSWVKPGNNHHVLLRQREDRRGRATWTGEVVTMWEAAQRARTNRPIVEQGDDVVFSLARGESFRVDDPDKPDERPVCVVHKITNRASGIQIYFKLHTDAQPEKERKERGFSPRQLHQLHAEKVAVDPLGRLQRSGT
jgi:CRISPR-associated endonuclease Csn1